jgi:hypothetical protein
VRLKALSSVIILSLISFCISLDSHEYRKRLTRRGAQFVHIGMQVTQMAQVCLCLREIDHSFNNLHYLGTVKFSLNVILYTVL